MPRSFFGALAATVAFLAAACSSGSHAASVAPAPERSTQPDSAALALARADSLRHPYTQADIDFMTGMIGHHAQAIDMADWAPTHGASAPVQRLAARIVNAQQDEIATMQQWLRERRLPAPDPATGSMARHGDGHSMMMMPGMLTEAQMHQLDSAQGPQFDRLFLTSMIQHHKGAVSMVKDLFGTNGAAQDELVFKFANDVNVDQSTEIARMELLLDSLPPDHSSP